MESSSKFTFHYVSIKSMRAYTIDYPSRVFTFHYVSIKSILLKLVRGVIVYLHSTMYLLNPVKSCDIYVTVMLIYIPLCIY